jgi:hypothetical protein
LQDFAQKPIANQTFAIRTAHIARTDAGSPFALERL